MGFKVASIDLSVAVIILSLLEDVDKLFRIRENVGLDASTVERAAVAADFELVRNTTLRDEFLAFGLGHGVSLAPPPKKTVIRALD